MNTPEVANRASRKGCPKLRSWRVSVALSAWAFGLGLSDVHVILVIFRPSGLGVYGEVTPSSPAPAVCIGEPRMHRRVGYLAQQFILYFVFAFPPYRALSGRQYPLQLAWLRLVEGPG
jgi:hypothetical protein